MKHLERLNNYFRRVVEREVVTSVYTALGFDSAIDQHLAIASTELDSIDKRCRIWMGFRKD
jgi:hypothetical protein